MTMVAGNGAPTTVWRILWDDGDEEFFSTAEILADEDLTFIKKPRAGSTAGQQDDGKGKAKAKPGPKPKGKKPGPKPKGKPGPKPKGKPGPKPKAKAPAAGGGGSFPSGKSSRYKGVSWAKRCNRWEAQLQHEGTWTQLDSSSLAFQFPVRSLIADR